jgi:hypothetical protein
LAASAPPTMRENATMDEMKLLEDFRAAVAPPDDRILAQARSRMLAADPDRSATRARSPLRRVRWPQLAVSGAAIAAIAVTLSVVLPGGADGTFATKAWAVGRNPNGTVTVTTTQQLQDPAGLQRALREDGITAYVQVNGMSQGQQGGGAACSYAHLDMAPEAIQAAVVTANQIYVRSGETGSVKLPTGHPVVAELLSWTIHPSAMPPGSSILLVDWVSRVFRGVMHPVVISADTAPVCSPTSAS